MAGVAILERYGELFDQAAELAATTGPEATSRLYLLILYSLSLDEFHALSRLAIPEKRDFLRTFDLELLALEKAARVRNLKKHLSRACWLADSLNRLDWAEPIPRFVCSRAFW